MKPFGRYAEFARKKCWPLVSAIHVIDSDPRAGNHGRQFRRSCALIMDVSPELYTGFFTYSELM